MTRDRERVPRALTLIAEEHPQSPKQEGVPSAYEIVGQARNEG